MTRLNWYCLGCNCIYLLCTQFIKSINFRAMIAVNDLSLNKIKKTILIWNEYLSFYCDNTIRFELHCLSD